MYNVFFDFMQNAYNINKDYTKIIKQDTIILEKQNKNMIKKIVLDKLLTEELNEKRKSIKAVYYVMDIDSKTDEIERKWICVLDKEEQQDFYLESSVLLIASDQKVKEWCVSLDLYDKNFELDEDFEPYEEQYEIKKILLEKLLSLPE